MAVRRGSLVSISELLPTIHCAEWGCGRYTSYPDRAVRDSGWIRDTDGNLWCRIHRDQFVWNRETHEYERPSQ